ncbi:MAG TPA: hypothetical protein PKW52_08950, partial [Nitrospira sp.]|nr:hypothetical protein [Nitrospira sp.]
MNRRTFASLMIVVGSLGAGLCGSGDAAAVVSNADYTAVPPFVSSATTPNIIILMDNSGSMSNLGNCDGTDDGDCVDFGTGPIDKAFTNTATWAGYFDSLTCYTYDTTDTRFEPAAVRTTLADSCSTTQWDGNFLNWATLRRFDAVKKAMHGGDCFATRAADGTCPTNGTPALKTIVAQG